MPRIRAQQTARDVASSEMQVATDPRAYNVATGITRLAWDVTLVLVPGMEAVSRRPD